jgi:hypothetical protein
MFYPTDADLAIWASVTCGDVLVPAVFDGCLEATDAGSATQKPPPPESVRIGDGGFERCRHRPTLPRSLDRSTIGAAWLNDRVRDGNGCGPSALDASDFVCARSYEIGPTGRSNVKASRSPAGVARIANGSGSDLGGSSPKRGDPDVRSVCEYCLVLLGPLEKPGGSQAARAIRTAALGTPRGASTCCLSTE